MIAADEARVRKLVAEDISVTRGVHERAILFDPRWYLISSADGPLMKTSTSPATPSRRMARGMRLMLDDRRCVLRLRGWEWLSHGVLELRVVSGKLGTRSRQGCP
jgi:hypothetical protein